MLHAAVVQLQLHIFGNTIDAAKFDTRPAIASSNFRIVSERDFIRIALQKLFADQWMRSHAYEGTRLARNWSIAGRYAAKRQATTKIGRLEGLPATREETIYIYIGYPTKYSLPFEKMSLLKFFPRRTM